MEFETFVAQHDDSDRRIDKIIRKFIPNISLSLIYKYIRKGLIKVNDKKIKPETHVYENDKIQIAGFILPKISEKYENQNLTHDLDIVFENKDILIINKPYDVTVQGFENSINKKVLDYYYSKMQSNSLSFKPGPLHRLDRKTTGLLCFSMSLEGARWFSENLKAHNIQKKYYGLVQGTLFEPQIWTNYISKTQNITKTSSFNVVNISTQKTDDKFQKFAQTDVTPIKYGHYDGKQVTLAEFFIHTGRTHQIRAQCMQNGFPLLGDTAYNAQSISNSNIDFFLQASSLIFPKENPLGLPEVVHIKLNDYFSNFLLSCDINGFDL